MANNLAAQRPQYITSGAIASAAAAAAAANSIQRTFLFLSNGTILHTIVAIRRGAQSANLQNLLNSMCMRLAYVLLLRSRYSLDALYDFSSHARLFVCVNVFRWSCRLHATHRCSSLIHMYMYFLSILLLLL